MLPSVTIQVVFWDSGSQSCLPFRTTMSPTVCPVYHPRFAGRLSDVLLEATTTPFFATLAQKGLLEYPLFAFSLTRNNTGSLSFGTSQQHTLYDTPSRSTVTDRGFQGAIDASVVANASDIAWNRVASFPPFNGETNATEAAYLQWAIPLSGLYVSNDLYPTDFCPLMAFLDQWNNP